MLATFCQDIDEKKGGVCVTETERVEKARLARNAYQREWRRKNKEKVREINERYWQKRIMAQANDGGEGHER
mgnify:CR=1 FL=1